VTLGNNNGTDGQTDRQTDGQTECDAICGPLLNVCGRYRVADIDLWPISTLLVANVVFCVADIAVADMVCGRYRCNSSALLCFALMTTRLQVRSTERRTE